MNSKAKKFFWSFLISISVAFIFFICVFALPIFNSENNINLAQPSSVSKVDSQNLPANSVLEDKDFPKTPEDVYNSYNAQLAIEHPIEYMANSLKVVTDADIAKQEAKIDLKNNREKDNTGASSNSFQNHQNSDDLAYTWDQETFTIKVGKSENHKDWTSFDSNGTAGWYKDYRYLAKILEIEEEIEPVTLRAWCGCVDYPSTGTVKLSSITQIKGLSNIKFTNLTDTSFMFIGCKKLQTPEDWSTWFQDLKYSNKAINAIQMFALSSGENVGLTSQDFVSAANGLENTTNVSLAFANNINLTKFPDVKYLNCQDFSNMLVGCKQLSDFGGISLVTNKVVKLTGMFANCTGLNILDLSEWKTGSSLNRIDGVFYNCASLKTIYANENFATASLTEINDTFYGCSNLEGGAGTKYSVVKIGDGTYARIDQGASSSTPGYFTNPSRGLWYGISDNGTLYLSAKMTQEAPTQNDGALNATKAADCGWNGQRTAITNVVIQGGLEDLKIRPQSTAYWFYNLSNATSISGLTNVGTSNVTNMGHMFDGCAKLTELDVSEFNTSEVTNMIYMFNNCSALTKLDVSKFNTANVTNMTFLFRGCSALTKLDVSKFNTANVTNMSYMFYNCLKLNTLDASLWDTSNVTDMCYLFCLCNALPELNVSKFNTAKVTNMSSMFNGCRAVTELDVSSFATDNVTDMNNMFHNCNALTKLNVSNFNTAKVINMSSMFYNCPVLSNLDVSNFNTATVTNMACMFYNCKALTELDLTSFNTSQVTNMEHMFANCESISTLDLTKFNTAKVTDVTGMFSFTDNRSSLKTIYATKDFVTTSVGEGKDIDMFAGSIMLVGGKNTQYSSAHVNKEYARIDQGPSSSAPGYFTLKTTH